MNKKYLIPVIDESGKIVDGVEFIDNLTRHDAPSYVNYGGLVGITRLVEGKHEGELVMMYFFKEQQELSYGEFVSEEEAYRECAIFNRLDVAFDLNIQLAREVEVA